MSKANIVHRLFAQKILSPELVEKLLNISNDEDIDEDYFIDNMDCLRNIEPTIEELRLNYPNDNFFNLTLMF